MLIKQSMSLLSLSLVCNTKVLWFYVSAPWRISSNPPTQTLNIICVTLSHQFQLTQTEIYVYGDIYKKIYEFF